MHLKLTHFRGVNGLLNYFLHTMRSSLFYFFALCSFLGFAQSFSIDDEQIIFHQSRRDSLRSMMPKNSVAIVFANPIRNRSNDVDFVYHQDPNFYYLTGWKEPHAVLVLYSSTQIDENGAYNEKLFVQERNARMEMWNGKRLGVDGAKKMGFDRVALRNEFIQSPLDFSIFEEVLIFDFENDERDLDNDPYDLYQLKKTFKQSIGFPLDFNRTKYSIQQAIRSVTNENYVELKRQINRQINRDSTLLEDDLIRAFVESEALEVPTDLKIKSAFALRNYFFDVEKLERYLGTLREEKTSFELKKLIRAIEISAIGQVEVMKALNPEMSEREVQGIHEYVFKKYGAAYEGYPSIVGAGNNACVLHYIENNEAPTSNDLILMDLGAEYQGYTADVTRTLPVNGKFSEEQRLLYEIVYNAQEAGILIAKKGTRLGQITRATQQVVAAGLVELGIIENEKDFGRYYPHGAAHHIGLDVHDLNSYGPLRPNAIITVEPGIYIPDGSPCDPKWWGIGIRIEDDILITEDTPINLSEKAPRKWQEIEKMMRETSPLDQFKLPELSQ